MKRDQLLHVGAQVFENFKSVYSFQEEGIDWVRKLIFKQLVHLCLDFGMDKLYFVELLNVHRTQFAVVLANK